MKSIGLMMALLAQTGFPDPFNPHKRCIPQTPEPPQTEEQKQWYLNRAAERRAKRAAKKSAQLAKQTKP